MKSRLPGTLVAAAIVLFGSSLSAQSNREGSPPAEVKSHGAELRQVLATEAAARLGINPSESSRMPEASAVPVQKEPGKWSSLIFLGIVLLAVTLLFVAGLSPSLG